MYVKDCIFAAACAPPSGGSYFFNLRKSSNSEIIQAFQYDLGPRIELKIYGAHIQQHSKRVPYAHKGSG